VGWLANSTRIFRTSFPSRSIQTFGIALLRGKAGNFTRRRAFPERGFGPFIQTAPRANASFLKHPASCAPKRARFGGSAWRWCLARWSWQPIRGAAPCRGAPFRGLSAATSSRLVIVGRGPRTSRGQSCGSTPNVWHVTKTEWMIALLPPSSGKAMKCGFSLPMAEVRMAFCSSRHPEMPGSPRPPSKGFAISALPRSADQVVVD